MDFKNTPNLSLILFKYWYLIYAVERLLVLNLFTELSL